jgi:hypothetical protein
VTIMAQRYCFNVCKKDKPKTATVEYAYSTDNDSSAPTCDMLTCEEKAVFRVSTMIE